MIIVQKSEIVMNVMDRDQRNESMVALIMKP